MRPIVLLILTAFAAGCSTDGVATPSEIDAKLERPNIIIMMAEDMSSRVAAFGDPVAVTPNLDSLAAQGVRFTNAFTTAGVCAPSRNSHILGMHQIATGGQHMRTSAFKESVYLTVPPADVKAYPELLRRAGYYTFTNRKLDYQFSTYAPGSGPFTIWDAELPEPEWAGREAGQPFFGLVNLPQTHESQLFDKNVAANKQKGLTRVVNPENVQVPPYYPDTPVVREYIARQYDNIYIMDKYVGSLLAQLEADGLAENTIIIWTTDHGDGLPRAKREIYDSGIKVPMIVVWPEKYRPAWQERGGVDNRLVSFVDLGPTVLSIAGVSVPENMHGSPVLADDSAEREYVYAAKDRLDEFPFRERAVRDKRYKYIRNFIPDSPGGTHLAYRDQLGIMAELWEFEGSGKLNDAQAHWFKPRPAEELYDLDNDPHETNNVAAAPAYAETLERMRDGMDTWLAEIGDRSYQTELDMAKEFWPGGLQPETPSPEVLNVGKNLVELAPGVPGASIGYRFDQGRWQVYTPGAQIRVPEGAILSAKSVRYGWQASVEVTMEF
jgi:arylsulfatase A-like enzyme